MGEDTLTSNTVITVDLFPSTEILG